MKIPFFPVTQAREIVLSSQLYTLHDTIYHLVTVSWGSPEKYKQEEILRKSEKEIMESG